MPIRVQLRRDTAANWTAANPVLMDGEFGYDKTEKKFKVGDGSTAWNSLPYTMTGPTGPQGPMGPPPVILTGPTRIAVVGIPFVFSLQFKDSYTAYSVSAGTGTVSLSGSTITYTGTQIGNDTVTIAAGDDSREVVIQVIATALAEPPAAAPAIGSAMEGGYYTGAVWDTATYATGSYATAIGAPTLTIQAADLNKFYIGQPVRLAPTNQSHLSLMEGTVIAGSGDQLTLDITSVLFGSGTYSSWTIAVGWNIIVAPKSLGENSGIQYKTATTASPAATITLTNGKAATAALQAENTNPVAPLNPLAQWVTNVNNAGGINGYADWYIPARDELELIWRNLKPITNNNTTVDRAYAYNYNKDCNYPDSNLDLTDMGKNNNSIPVGPSYTTTVPAQTSVAAFQTGQAEAMGGGDFWSASEYSSSNAWRQTFSTSSPGSQSTSYKSYNGRARAVRRSLR